MIDAKLLDLCLFGIKIVREPYIHGMKDKDGEPVHAIRFETNGPIYMDPVWFDKLADLDTAVAAAVATEREECRVVCRAIARNCESQGDTEGMSAAAACAGAIGGRDWPLVTAIK